MVKLSVDKQDFQKRFLGERIIVEKDTVEDTSDYTDGFYIESQPIFKTAALRLKEVLARYKGDIPVYIGVSGQVVKAGHIDLTFDAYTALHRVIQMYQPEYTLRVDGEAITFDKESLIHTAKLPKEDNRDYYMT